MALLPDRNIFDGSRPAKPTTADMKSTWGTLRDFIAAFLGTDSDNKEAARTLMGVSSTVDVQAGKMLFAPAAGTGDAMTVALVPPVVTLVDGMVIHTRTSGQSTSTTPTLKVNGLPAVTICGANGAALPVGAYPDKWPASFRYRASTDKFELLNPAPKETAQYAENLLINTLFAINQDSYTSGTATGTALQYVIDQWRVDTSGQALTLEALGSSAYGYIATAPAGGISQPIPGYKNAGGVHTLNWEGTATATVNGTAIAKGGQTASLTAGANVIVKFIGGTVSRPRFVRGLADPGFIQRDPDIELALCQVFYEKGLAYYEGYATPSVPLGAQNTRFRVLKYTVPTMTFGTFNSIQNATAGGSRAYTSKSEFVRYCVGTTAGAATATEPWTANSRI